MIPLAELIGESPGLVTLREKIRKVLGRQAGLRRPPPILLLGETGTGKGLVARAIHRASSRADGPFVDVSCAAIPENLLEAEMFGFERGAFTDARQPKAGLFQTAHRGIIFLDEVGLLPQALQGKLLKAIEERAVRRLGSTRTEPADVWILSATSVDLVAATRERRFREDLYHRLAILTVSLPALRERGPDILILAEHFLVRACVDYGLPQKSLTPDARTALLAYPWPGNVRELGNVVERVALLSETETVTASMLELPGASHAATSSSAAREPARLSDALGHVERQHLLAALEQSGWNITHAAARLGISRDTLRYRITKHGLRPGGPAARASRAKARPFPAPPSAANAAPETSPRGLQWERRRVALLRAALGPTASGDAPGAGFRAVQLFAEKVESFGGHIEEMGPAGLVAIFGAEPVEDPARRVAHAALAIRRAAEHSESGARAKVRLAVLTKQLLVTRAGRTARMEFEAKHQALACLDSLIASAAPGDIVVTEETAAALERRFNFAPGNRTEGVPGAIYSLVGPERAGLPTSRRMTTFVGRERHLAILQDQLSAAQGGAGQVVVIVGEPGIGKSRLLFEFRQSLAARPITYLEGHCLPHAKATPDLPLLDLLRQHFGIAEADNPGVITDKICSGVAETGLDPAQVAPYLLHLLALTEGVAAVAALSPEAVKARTFEILREICLRSSRQHTIVLAVEDVHWIDKASEEWLESMVAALAGAPVLFISTCRTDHQPPWLPQATQVSLQPLGTTDSLRIVRDVLAASLPSEGLAQSIIDRAEGNPLFLEELSRAIAERGLDRTLHPGSIPDTIHAVLQARIDRLGDEAKRLLDAAAVIGRRVSLRLLREVWEGSGIADAYLGELSRLDLLYDDSAGEEPAYVFRHALIREVVYENLSLDRRRSLHAAAGCAIESLFAGRLDEVSAPLAHHFSRAERPAEAVKYLSRAADKAARRYAHSEAIIALEEALGHVQRLPADEQDRAFVEVILRQAYSLTFLGRFQEILGLLLQYKARLERLDAPAMAGPYYFWLGYTYSLLGEPEQSAEFARRALDEAKRAADLTTMGKAYFVLAYECFWSGRPGEGVERARLAVAHLERTDERWWLGRAHWIAGMNLGLMGEFERALEAEARAHAIGEAIGDPRVQSSAEWTSGGIHAVSGDWDAGVAACQRGLELSPDPVSAAVARGFLGGAYLEKGDAHLAIPLLERAAGECGHFRVRQTQGWFTILLAEAYLLIGDVSKARELATTGLHITHEIKYQYGIGWAQRSLGRVALAAGSFTQARIHFGEAHETFAAMDARYEIARTQLDLAQLDQMCGEHAGVATHLRAALRLFNVLRLSRYVERTAQLAVKLGVRVWDEPSRDP